MTTHPLKLSGLALLLVTSCAAEFEVGHGALILESTLSGAYDSNIRASASETEDTYLTFDPTARFRQVGSRFTTEASAGVIFKRYNDHTEFNSDDVHARFNWEMPRENGQTTGASLAIGYVETSDAIVEVNDRVRSRNLFANNSGEVLVAGRHLLSAGLTYYDNQHNIGSDQKSAGGHLGYTYMGIPDGTTISTTYSHQANKSEDAFSGNTVLDQTADTAALSIAHPFTGDFVVAATYGYRWLDRGAAEAALALMDQHGSFFDLTFNGPFLPKQYFPKTTGTFRLAYEQSDVPGLNDPNQNRIVGQLNIAWAARERTTVNFFASRSQTLSVGDFTVVNASTGIKVSQGIGSFITTSLDLRYTKADFVNLSRTDDRYETQVSAAYQVNRAWSASLAYRYLDSQSNAAIADYNRHLVVLTIHYVL